MTHMRREEKYVALPDGGVILFPVLVLDPEPEPEVAATPGYRKLLLPERRPASVWEAYMRPQGGSCYWVRPPKGMWRGAYQRHEEGRED